MPAPFEMQLFGRQLVVCQSMLKLASLEIKLGKVSIGRTSEKTDKQQRNSRPAVLDTVNVSELVFADY